MYKTLILRHFESRSRPWKHVSSNHLRFPAYFKFCFASTIDSIIWLQNFACHWTSRLFPILHSKRFS